MIKIKRPAHNETRIIEKRTILPLRVKSYRSGFFEKVKIKQQFVSPKYCCENYGWKNLCFIDENGNDLINMERPGDPCNEKGVNLSIGPSG